MDRQNMRKSLSRRSHRLMAVVSLLVFAGIVFLSWGCGSTSPASSAGPTEHVQGSPNARVVIEEWVDLQ